MLFSSLTFIFIFLPIVLGAYYVLSFSLILKNTVLLIASLFFYAWGEPKFVLVLIASILANYVYGLLVDHYRERHNIARLVITLMCLTNLGLLFVYKYLAFALSSIYGLFGTTNVLPTIALPIGISFFTFQAMSYVLDVYRCETEVQKNPFYLALYVAFFPQLVAGPIVRYASIAEQMTGRTETLKKFSLGCCRFVTGLGKKIIIANSMAIITDQIFALNSSVLVPMSLAWLGAIAYTLQIFFDFSAYSDMAIGLGLMFGFKFDENFNYPYISKSITEFWRRWHISLSSWFKSYVYIPLGGSRVENKDIMVRNLLIVWLCTGVWHGASWTFVLWGVLNFFFILVEKITDFDKLKIPNIVRHIYALFAIVMGWTLFRSENFLVARQYYYALFGGSGQIFSDYAMMFLREYGVIFAIAIVLSTPIAGRINYSVGENRKGAFLFNIAYPIGIVLLFTVSVAYLVVGSYNPFIYFNF